MRIRGAVIALMCLSFVSAPAAAQTLPSEPVTFGDGRVVVGGDISAAFGATDPGFFNYTDYEY